MKTRNLSAIIAMAVIAISMLTGASSANAQLCANIQVINQTSCDVGICFYDAGGNRVCLNLGPNGTASSIGFLNGFAPVGVFSASKTAYPFTGTPFCTPCIRIPGWHTTIGCCATVCYDALTCTIRIAPCLAPCLP